MNGFVDADNSFNLDWVKEMVVQPRNRTFKISPWIDGGYF